MTSRRNISARIQLFHIDHIGWHSTQGTPASIPVPLQEVLQELATFAAEKALGDTSTYAPTDGIQPSYLLNMTSESDNHLITLWVESNDDQLAHYASKRSESGNISITDKATPADTIAGIPCHFWIMTNARIDNNPNANLIATVQTRPTPMTGLPSLRAYIEGFLRRHMSDWRPSNLNDSYIPRLTSRRLFNGDSVNRDIINSWADIRAIVSREIIHRDVPPPDTWISRIQHHLRINEPTRQHKTKWKFENETPFTPKDASEVARIIEDSLSTTTSADHERDEDHRLGFKFKTGSGKMKGVNWISKRQVVSRQHLSATTLKNSSVLDPKSLLAAVARTRQDLLDALA